MTPTCLSHDQQRRALWLTLTGIALFAAAVWWGGHRQQTWLDTQCRHGIATACALDGRP